uniref:Uncharacterized protein n=1 Tax=Romanomermis culicivorax TaxID=13658 RepID=A0A915L784_ROMCU
MDRQQLETFSLEINFRSKRMKGHLYVPFSPNGTEFNRAEGNESFLSVLFGWTLPSVVFPKIAGVVSDRKPHLREKTVLEKLSLKIHRRSKRITAILLETTDGNFQSN